MRNRPAKLCRAFPHIWQARHRKKRRVVLVPTIAPSRETYCTYENLEVRWSWSNIPRQTSTKAPRDRRLFASVESPPIISGTYNKVSASSKPLYQGKAHHYKHVETPF